MSFRSGKYRSPTNTPRGNLPTLLDSSTDVFFGPKGGSPLAFRRHCYVYLLQVIEQGGHIEDLRGRTDRRLRCSLILRKIRDRLRKVSPY